MNISDKTILLVLALLSGAILFIGILYLLQIWGFIR